MLDGKVALVTGAGRGIGRGIALELARNGAKVVVNDYGVSLSGSRETESPAQRVVQEIRDQGGQAVADDGSVSDFEDAGKMIQRGLDEFGRFDIVIHVAGILRDRMLFNMSEEEWDAVIAVHLKGAFNTFHAASKVMRAQRGGRLIAMSSDSAYGSPGQPNYAAAKAGILGLVWSTAAAMGRYNVTANAIMPNGATRMLDATSIGQEVLEKEGKPLSELATGTERDPNNVAPLAAYLASEQAANVNGQIFYSQGYAYGRLAQPRLEAVVRKDRAWTLEELSRVAGSSLAAELEPPFFNTMSSFVNGIEKDHWLEADGYMSWRS